MHRKTSTIVAIAVAAVLMALQPVVVHAACTPNRTAATETHQVGMVLGANEGVNYTALKATFELNEPYVHGGTSYMYLGLRDTSSSATVNFGIKKSATSGNWVGYMYVRDAHGDVQTTPTFDPYSYDLNNAVWLEVRKQSYTDADGSSRHRWRFYANGTLIHSSVGEFWFDFGTFTQSYAYGKIENRRSQMPGGTSDHTSVTNAWYWTNVGNASWSGTPVGYNTTYFGFTESPFEFWDKYCPS